MERRSRKPPPVTRWSMHVALAMLGALWLGALWAPRSAIASTRPAPARQDDRIDRNRIVIVGPVDVPAGSRLDNVFVIRGDVTVEGDVTGTVFVGHGALTVSGAVGGNVISLGGAVRITSTGHVRGDLNSRERPVIAPGGSVAGRIRRERFQGFHIGAGTRIFIAAAIAVSAFLLGLFLLLFAPRAADAVDVAGRTAVGPVIGWGFFALLVVPLVVILLAVTILGIPLTLGVLLASPLFYWVGWVWGAWILGRAILRPPRHRVLAFSIGWAIVSGVAFVPIAGGVAGFAAAIYGLGAMTVAAHRARRWPFEEVRPSRDGPAPPAAPPVPPPPPGSLAG